MGFGSSGKSSSVSVPRWGPGGKELFRETLGWAKPLFFDPSRIYSSPQLRMLMEMSQRQGEQKGAQSLTQLLSTLGLPQPARVAAMRQIGELPVKTAATLPSEMWRNVIAEFIQQMMMPVGQVSVSKATGGGGFKLL